MRKSGSRLALSVLLLATSVLADDFVHRRRDSLTVDNETVLSAIDLYDSKVEQVIANLGAPSRVAETAASERSYEWDRKTCRLKILALDNGSITRIDVWGTTPDSGIGTTGRGLKLGATIDDARRLYIRFPADSDPTLKGYSYWDCAPSRPVLGIDFGKGGRIDHMKLTREPSDCF